MAAGVRARAGVEVGVGITGIAGPGGGSDLKPVGTVVIAVAFPEGAHARTFRFFGGRAQIKFQASQAALDMVRRLLER
jgi:nicotinamide-nucleotide amidase